MCDVEPGETFLARERIYRVTEDTSEFPDGRIRVVVLYTQTSLCIHLHCVYVRGKMEGLFLPLLSLCVPVSIYSFSSRPCLHQEGKKKLIPDPFTTRTQGNSSIVQKGGTRYANCVLPVQLRFANGLDPVNISFIISKAQSKYRFYIGNRLFHKFMFICCADFAFAINVRCNKKESSVR